MKSVPEPKGFVANLTDKSTQRRDNGAPLNEEAQQRFVESVLGDPKTEADATRLDAATRDTRTWNR